MEATHDDGRKGVVLCAVGSEYCVKFKSGEVEWIESDEITIGSGVSR